MPYSRPNGKIIQARAKLFLTRYDWQFSETPSYFEAGLLEEIDNIINNELLSDPNYFKNLKFKLGTETRMTNQSL